MYSAVRSSRAGIPLLRILTTSCSRYAVRSISSCGGWSTSSILPMACPRSLGSQDDVEEPQRHPARVVDRRAVEPLALVAREEGHDAPDVLERARPPGGNQLAHRRLQPIDARRPEPPPQ